MRLFVFDGLDAKSTFDFLFAVVLKTNMTHELRLMPWTEDLPIVNWLGWERKQIGHLKGCGDKGGVLLGFYLAVAKVGCDVLWGDIFISTKEVQTMKEWVELLNLIIKQSRS